jgi:flagellar L-ring protein precursor FlgH
MSKLVKIIIVAFSLWGTACTVQQPPRPNDPFYAPVMQLPSSDKTVSNGSLYSERTVLELFSDRKAKRVGDVITIVLQENTQSNKAANIEIRKENEISDPNEGAGTIFGIAPSAGDVNLGLNVINDREFRGQSLADQSNRLTGNISVTVVDIYPNGTLVVRGEKWITLNQGEEFIRISGLVRPDDIGPDNTLVSNRLANARIQYSGTGEIANSQSMGWVSRFFNSPLWPF